MISSAILGSPECIPGRIVLGEPLYSGMVDPATAYTLSLTPTATVGGTVTATITPDGVVDDGVEFSLLRSGAGLSGSVSVPSNGGNPVSASWTVTQAGTLTVTPSNDGDLDDPDAEQCVVSAVPVTVPLTFVGDFGPLWDGATTTCTVKEKPSNDPVVADAAAEEETPGAFSYTLADAEPGKSYLATFTATDDNETTDYRLDARSAPPSSSGSGGTSTVALDGGTVTRAISETSFAATGDLPAPSGGYVGMRVLFQDATFGKQARYVLGHTVALDEDDAEEHIFVVSPGFTSSPGFGANFLVG